MAAHGIPRTGEIDRNAKAGWAMRAIKATACMCCLVQFIIMVPALNNSAWPRKFAVKSINIRQLLVSETSNERGNYKLSEQYLLKCNGTTCVGRLPIILMKKTYYYDTVAVISKYDPIYVNVNINLRPTEPACGPRCDEPTLNAISTYIPWAREAHITAPVKQYGDFPATTSPDSTTDLIYRVHQDPVAYIDLSFELE